MFNKKIIFVPLTAILICMDYNTVIVPLLEQLCLPLQMHKDLPGILPKIKWYKIRVFKIYNVNLD